MTDLYEKMKITGRFLNSAGAMKNKTNQYGEPRDIETCLKASTAETIASDVANNIVAEGIATAIELGKPAYGEIGESFLKQKDPDYKPSKLAIILTKIMLSGIETEEADMILTETEKVLDGEKNLSKEAQIAVIAIKIYDGSNKFANRKDFASCSSCALSKILEAYDETGMVAEIPYLDRLEKKEPEKPIIPRTEKDTRRLETVYSYYINHYNEIPDEFIDAATDFTKECVVAYYVTSMSETDLITIEKKQTLTDNK